MQLAKCANHGLEECPKCGTYAVMRTAKQVIVMRKDLNMRKGKMCAQAAHASLGAVWLIEEEINGTPMPEIKDYRDLAFYVPPHEAYFAWKKGTFTKICVGVDSEDELTRICDDAIWAGLPVKLIIDNGATEFNGVRTKTCLAIGPAWSNDIDKITGHLKLL